jgi:NADH-quinone oxidoreductase subunit E
MNFLLEKYPQEVAGIIGKYPGDQKQSALMPLLFLAQEERGHVTKQSILDIAQILDISTTDVMSVVGFYTLYYTEEDAPRYRVQVCTDLSCALGGAEAFLANLCENVGIKVGETTPDGLVKIEEVVCLAGCDKGPMFQVQGDGKLVYYENQTVQSALQLIDDLKRRAGETGQ